MVHRAQGLGACELRAASDVLSFASKATLPTTYRLLSPKDAFMFGVRPNVASCRGVLSNFILELGSLSQFKQEGIQESLPLGGRLLNFCMVYQCLGFGEMKTESIPG